MNESDLEGFRQRYRVAILEHLVLKTAFLASHLEGSLNVAQTALALKDWLETNSAKADQVYGAAFQDPALTAVFSDEVRSIVDDIKKKIDQVGKDAAETFGS